MSRLARALRADTTGGVLLLLGALVALVWANSPWSSAYAGLRDLDLGPAGLHLDLSLGAWAADGLLAIFFFVAGLELKRELLTGSLRDPRRAVLPVAAAVGGMVVPAAVFVLWNLGDPGALQGWAVPTATDIAFALAVLAVVGSHLPAGVRTFLLTLAVVDDLLAITVIAVFYTDALAPLPLLLALGATAVFGVLARRGLGALLVPLAVVTWALVHASGIHPTVAGVLLAAVVPVGRVDRLEHLWRPVSSGFAVPVFAFFAAGVGLGGLSGLADSLQDRVALGVLTGLVVGKAVGIAGTTYVVDRFTRARLDPALRWSHVVGLALLGGIGFTVSLLVGQLAYGAGSLREDHVKVGVLGGSLVSALLATAVLRRRDRTGRRILTGADG